MATLADSSSSSKASTTLVPLSQLCVAAGVAGGDGKILECNELFRELVLVNGSDGDDGEKKKSLNDIDIWELAQLNNKDDEEPDEIRNKVVTLSQGPNVPSKWVRVHIHKLASDDANQQWLIQMEDIDAGLRAKNQWSAILETTYDGFWDYHIARDYEYMSPRFWEMFGYAPHEKEHKPSEWMDMIHPDDLKASFVDLENHFQSKGEIPYCRETRYRHKNGSWVWVLCRGKVIEWDDSGTKPLRMIGTHTDITESKLKAAREKELVAANESFKAEKQLNEFVSHEVRNPLAAAIASTQFLEMELKGHDNKELEEDVLIVSQSLEYIHQLLTSMLDLNKFLEKGGVQLNPRPTLLKKDITTPIYQLYKHRALDKIQFEIQHWWISPVGGKLQQIPDGADQQILVDVVRLKQILINLLSNAIKFTREGYVRVMIGRFSKDTPTELTMIVEDTGPGIPPDKRSLLFEKYVQLSTQIQGSGIGLALTKQLVEAMNGSITIDDSYKSGMGKQHTGTRFVVTIEAPIVKDVDNSSSGGNNNNTATTTKTKTTTTTTTKKAPAPTMAAAKKNNGVTATSTSSSSSSPPPKSASAAAAASPPAPTPRSSQPATDTTTTTIRGGRGQQQQHPYYHRSSGGYNNGQPPPPPPPHHHYGGYYHGGPPPPPPPQHYNYGYHHGGPPPPPPPGAYHYPYDYGYGGGGPPPPPPPPPNHHPPHQYDPHYYYGGETSPFPPPPVSYHPQEPQQQSAPPTTPPAPNGGANGGLMMNGDGGGGFNGNESNRSMNHYHDQRSHHTPLATTDPSSSSNRNSSQPNANGNKTRLTANLKVLVVDDDPIIRKLLTRRLKNIDPSMTIETVESGELAIDRIQRNDQCNYDLVMMDHFMPLGGGVLTGEETIKIIRPYIQGVIAGSSGNDMRREHTDAGADLFWLKPVPKDEVLLNDLRAAFQQVKQQRHNGG